MTIQAVWSWKISPSVNLTFLSYKMGRIIPNVSLINSKYWIQFLNYVGMWSTVQIWHFTILECTILKVYHLTVSHVINLPSISPCKPSLEITSWCVIPYQPHRSAQLQLGYMTILSPLYHYLHSSFTMIYFPLNFLRYLYSLLN